MPMQHDVLVHVRWSEHCCLELQGTVYDSPLGHGLGFLRGWRSWSLSVYSGRPRHRPWTVKRTLNLLSSFFHISLLFSHSIYLLTVFLSILYYNLLFYTRCVISDEMLEFAKYNPRQWRRHHFLT